MKSIIKILAILPLFLLVTACPFRSSFPIEAATETTMDIALGGEWISYDSVEKGDTILFRFIPFDKHTYLVDISDFHKRHHEHDYYRCFTSEIDGVKILNAESIDEEERYYEFYKYRFEDGNLYLSFMEEDQMEETDFKDSKDFRKSLEKQMKKQNIWDESEDEIKLRRAPQKVENSYDD